MKWIWNAHMTLIGARIDRDRSELECRWSVDGGLLEFEWSTMVVQMECKKSG